MFGKSISTVKHWMTLDDFICRFDAGDLPLLVAIAGTHSPHLSLGVVWHRLLSCSLDYLYFTLEGCLIWTDLSLGVVLYGQIVCFPEPWGGLIKTDWPFKDLWDGLVYRNLLFTEPLFRQHYYVIQDQLSVIQALFLSSV